MSLDLSQIRFKVETEELELAVKKIESLGASVEGLATSIGKLDKQTAVANKTQAQANLTNAKAATEAAKAATEVAKANAITTKAQDQNTVATERLTKATKEKQSVEQQQEAITRIMSDGYSRGQATILARAEALGEVTTRTAELLKTQRAMQASDPFDKSIGAVTLFENRTRVLTVANELYQQSLGFTKEQLMDLGREHVRLSEQFKVQGKDMGGLDAEFQKIVQSAQKVTQAENAMAASMKNADKATIDAGKANAYIENELQKVRFALQANNEELNRSTSNSLVRFDNALKKSGLTLDQQKVKIDEYRKSQIELQKTQKANQTDYITRAVGPQITDIVVGLSTGQSPLTVMMQQGGQLRDQFGMMGIAAKDMGDVMRNAMKGMASSVFDTGKAITTMLAGGMFDAGKAVVNYASSFLFVDKAIEKARENIIGMSKDFDTATENLAKFDKVAGGIGKVFAFGVLAIITTLAAVGVAAVQNIKLMNELSQTLVSVGASYGLTSSQVVEYANAISGAGISTQGSIAAMTLMIKAGAGTAESLQSITLAAIELEKAGGQSVEATSKMYADLSKDPVKALSELRLNTGLVTEANMENIMSLVEQGREIDAVREAGLIMTDALTQSTKLLYEDMSPLQQLWIDMKGSLTNIWNGVNELATSSGVVIAFRVVWESVALVIKGVFNTIKGLSTAVVAVMHNDWTGAVNILKETFGTVADNYKDATEAVSKTTEAMTSGVKVQTEAVKKAQEQSKAEKKRLLTASALKDTKEKDEKLNAKTLSQSEFITKALEAKNKLLGQNNKLEGENLAMVQRVAKAEWEALQPKEKKAKLSDEQKAENKNLEAYIDLMNKAVGLNKDYNNLLDGLQSRKKNGKITEQEYVKAVEELIKQQKFYTDGLAEEEKAQKAAKKAAEEHMKLVEEFTKIQDEFTATSLKNQEGIQQENSALSLRVALLGKTEEEQKKINESYKAQGEISKINAKYDKERLELQQKYLKLQSDGFDVDYDVWNKQIQQSVQQQGEEAKLVWAGVAMSAAESMQKEFDAIKSSITDVITTALFDGGKAGSKKLRDQVVQAFRNKITVVIDAVVNTALSSLMGGSGGSTGGVGGGGSSGLSVGAGLDMAANNFLYNASASLYEAGFETLGGLTTQLANSTSSLLGSVGGLSNGLSYLNALNTAFSRNAEGGKDFGQAAGQAIGAYFGGPLGSMIGGKIGKALGIVDYSGTAHTGGSASYSRIKGTSLDASKELDFGPGSGMETSKAVTDTSAIIAKGIVGLLDQTAVTFGKESGYYAATAFADDISPDGSWGALKIKLGESILTDWEKGADTWPGREFGNKEQGMKEYTEAIALDVRSAINAIGLPEWAMTMLDNLGDAPSLDSLEKTIQAITEIQNVSVFLGETLGITTDSVTSLVNVIGNASTAFSLLEGFYQNFYTEEEQVAASTKNLSEAFSKLNIEMPAINESTREWYRSEVERLGAMDLSVESNAKAYASVLSLQGQVSQLAPAFDSVAQSAAAAAANMTSAWANVMQARGVASNEVTRFTAQADISSAFAEYKKTDKAGIVSAEQFLTISQDDFKLYSSEQQRLISTIISGFASIDSTYKDNIETVNNLNNSYQPYTESIKEVQAEIDKSIQATADYQMAIWEATGDTASAAIRQRELATATKLAAGWTQSQIDNLYGAQEAAAVLKQQKEQQELVTQATKDYQLALWEVTGDTVSAAKQQQELSKALRLSSGWTQEQLDNLYIKEKEAEIVSLQDEAMRLYIDSQNELVKAQKDYASVLKGTINSLQDFLNTLDNAGSPLENTRKARSRFGELSKKVSEGDTSIYSELAPAAKSFLDLSKNYSRTIQDYRRDEAAVRRTMNSVIQVNNSELAKLPSEISAASDPTKESWLKLKIANEKQSEASLLLTAMSVDRVASEARLSNTTKSLADRYLEVLKALPDSKELQDTFHGSLYNTMKDWVESGLPATESPFTFKDTFSDLVKEEIPVGFFGDKFNLSESAAEELRLRIPEMGDKFNLSESAAEELRLRLRIPEMGDKFNLSELAAEELRLRLRIPEMGEKFNLSESAAEELRLRIPEMGESPFTFKDTFSDLVKEEIPAGFFGEKFNLSESAAEELRLRIPEMGESFNLLSLTQAAINTAISSVINSAASGVPVSPPSLPPTVVAPPPPLPPAQFTANQNSVTNAYGSIGRRGTGSSPTQIDKEGFDYWLNRLETGSLNSSNFQGTFLSAVLGADKSIYSEAIAIAQDAITNKKTLPGFDIGTNYVPYDMTANIHKGERIIPEADNAELMQRLNSPQEDNSELINQLIYLNAKVQSLESSMIAGQIAIADNTRKTKNVLEKFDIDGLPKERV